MIKKKLLLKLHHEIVIVYFSFKIIFKMSFHELVICLFNCHNNTNSQRRYRFWLIYKKKQERKNKSPVPQIAWIFLYLIKLPRIDRRSSFFYKSKVFFRKYWESWSLKPISEPGNSIKCTIIKCQLSIFEKVCYLQKY